MARKTEENNHSKEGENYVQRGEGVLIIGCTLEVVGVEAQTILKGLLCCVRDWDLGFKQTVVCVGGSD